MNIQRFILCVLLFACVAGGLRQASFATDNFDYKKCTDQSVASPDEALKQAEAWIAKHKDPSAHHCRALALYALKRYGEAAVELDNLANTISTIDAGLWLNILKQAALAHELDGQPMKARQSLTRALSFTQEKPELKDETINILIERGRLALKNTQPLDAVQDMDYALSLNDKHTAARVERAQALLAAGDKEAAKEDVNAALAQEPQNTQAQQMLKKVQ